MSYGFDNSKLKRSISQVGIINNPYIYRCNDGSMEVVIGFRRILALKDLGEKEIKCFDLTESNLTSYDMLKFALYDNLVVREFNLVEKSIIINNLSLLVKDNNLINEVTSLINVNLKDYDLISKISNMDESIKNSISSGYLNLKTLEHLVQMSVGDQLICNNWINKLKLSYNQQIQFLDYINDISRIEKMSIHKLLGDEYYLGLLADEKKNIPQKAKELIDNLRARRNPDFTNYKRLFEQKIRKLRLPKYIKIKHPMYFESEFYQLEIEFKDGNELKKGLNELINRDVLETIGDPWISK